MHLFSIILLSFVNLACFFKSFFVYLTCLKKCVLSSADMFRGVHLLVEHGALVGETVTNNGTDAITEIHKMKFLN